MHTTRDYTVPKNAGINRKAQVDEQALKDFEQWFEGRVPILKQLARTTTRATFENWCSFGGCEGYPVRVAYSKYNEA